MLTLEEKCERAKQNALAAAQNELNVFCEIMGLPKNYHNYFIGDDPYGIVDIQEGYMFFNMSDIHVVISEYPHWLELYKSNEEIALVVKQWYYWTLDWHEKHPTMEWIDVNITKPNYKEKYIFLFESGGKCEIEINDEEDLHFLTSVHPIITHWMKATTPDGTHYCNLKSWLMGWRPDPKDVLPEYEEYHDIECAAAYTRVEEAKKALEDAIKDEVKLNKF